MGRVAGAIDSWAELIELWGTAVAFSGDLAVKVGTARQWKRRGIPSEYWTAVVQAAAARGLSQVSLEILARLSANAARRTRARAA